MGTTISRQYYQEEIRNLHQLLDEIEGSLLCESGPDEKDIMAVCMKLSRIIDATRSLHGQVAYDFS